jgi:phage protein D
MAAAPPATGVRVSRPTVTVAGREVATLSDGMLSLRVEDAVHGIAQCELSVGNWGPVGDRVDFLYFDRRDLDFGKAIAVKVGDATVFTGRITGLEGEFPEGSPPALVVLAEDRFQDLRMTRRTRTFENASDADVVRQIAGDHGLTPDVQLDGPTHRVIAQLDQSDLAFLRERCRGLDAEAWVDDRTLVVRRRADRGRDTLELGYGNQLRELTVTADLAGQATKVVVGGWDVAGKQEVHEAASGDVVQAELKGGDGGDTILRSAFAARTQTVAHTAPIASAEARARAEALYRRRARGFVRARGLAETSPSLRVGRSVRLTGVGRLFEGEYYVTEVRHLFDPELGSRTEFSAERPGLGRP